MYQNCSLISKFHLLIPGPTNKISTENRQSKSVYHTRLRRGQECGSLSRQEGMVRRCHVSKVPCFQDAGEEMTIVEAIGSYCHSLHARKKLGPSSPSRNVFLTMIRNDERNGLLDQEIDLRTLPRIAPVYVLYQVYHCTKCTKYVVCATEAI